MVYLGPKLISGVAWPWCGPNSGTPPVSRAAEERSFAILVAQTDGSPPNRDEVASYQALLRPLAVAGNPVEVAKFFEVSSLAIETQTASTIADVAVRLASGNSPGAAAIRRFQDARRALDIASARVARMHDATPAARKARSGWRKTTSIKPRPRSRRRRQTPGRSRGHKPTR